MNCFLLKDPFKHGERRPDNHDHHDHDHLDHDYHNHSHHSHDPHGNVRHPQGDKNNYNYNVGEVG